MIQYKSKLPELTFKYKTGETFKVKLTNSTDAYEYFKKLYDADTIEYCESVILLLLNQANNTIGFIKISQGGISGTVIDVRMIYAAALQAGASNIMISHNHPSGNTKPSDADIKITNQLKQAGEIMQIKLLDHIIMCNQNGYFSFADEGML